jgi:hypothetical protein
MSDECVSDSRAIPEWEVKRNRVHNLPLNKLAAKLGIPVIVDEGEAQVLQKLEVVSCEGIGDTCNPCGVSLMHIGLSKDAKVLRLAGLDLNLPEAPQATHFVYLFSGAQRGNATPVCDFHAVGYAGIGFWETEERFFAACRAAAEVNRIAAEILEREKEAQSG